MGEAQALARLGSQLSGGSLWVGNERGDDSSLFTCEWSLTVKGNSRKVFHVP